MFLPTCARAKLRVPAPSDEQEDENRVHAPPHARSLKMYKLRPGFALVAKKLKKKAYVERFARSHALLALGPVRRTMYNKKQEKWKEKMLNTHAIVLSARKKNDAGHRCCYGWLECVKFSCKLPKTIHRIA